MCLANTVHTAVMFVNYTLLPLHTSVGKGEMPTIIGFNNSTKAKKTLSLTTLSHISKLISIYEQNIHLEFSASFFVVYVLTHHIIQILTGIKALRAIQNCQ